MAVSEPQTGTDRQHNTTNRERDENDTTTTTTDDRPPTTRTTDPDRERSWEQPDHAVHTASHEIFQYCLLVKYFVEKMLVVVPCARCRP